MGRGAEQPDSSPTTHGGVEERGPEPGASSLGLPAQRAPGPQPEEGPFAMGGPGHRHRPEGGPRRPGRRSASRWKPRPLPVPPPDPSSRPAAGAFFRCGATACVRRGPPLLCGEPTHGSRATAIITPELPSTIPGARSYLNGVARVRFAYRVHVLPVCSPMPAGGATTCAAVVTGFLQRRNTGRCATCFLKSSGGYAGVRTARRASGLLGEGAPQADSPGGADGGE